ncbi:hypothetical protein [Rheinheimera fenheensis]|uniref:hypothetical protein n=1 Tax=Rheinheimera fenheensis TaxID=3152295 RepID=UPI0032610F2F
MAALNPIKPLFSASATATNGSAVINVTGNVDCSWLKPGSIVQVGTRQLVDAVSGTAPDGSGNSTITLRRNWADPTTTAPLLAFMSWEGLADAVVKLRAIAEANESALQGAFSFVGAWDAGPGDFPPAPAENTGTQMYRVSVAGTMGGRAYRVGEPIYYDQFTSQWRSFAEFASAYSTGLLALANIGEWQSALGLVPTASPADTTAGRLLKVGDGGLLAVEMGAGLILTAVDITLNRPSGKYRYANNCLNKPDGTNGFIEVTSRNSDTYTIRAVTDIGRVFEYTVISGSIIRGGWRPVYTNYDILGTVAQSGGIPTGAIIERGANANGEYVKYADGTMICYRTSVSGSGDRSETWTFPVTFSAVGVLHGNLFRANTDSSGGGYVNFKLPSNTTTATYQIKQEVVSSTQVLLTAIGRWF